MSMIAQFKHQHPQGHAAENVQMDRDIPYLFRHI